MPTTLSSVKTSFNSPNATLYQLRKGGGIVKNTDTLPNYPSGATDIKLSYLNGAAPYNYLNDPNYYKQTGLVTALFGEYFDASPTNKMYNQATSSSKTWDPTFSFQTTKTSGPNGKYYVPIARTRSINLTNTNTFPSKFLMFHVARYSTSGTAVKRRVFGGSGNNWISGFWGGYSGIANHDGVWLTTTGANNFPTSSRTDWIISSHTNCNYFASDTNGDIGIYGSVFTYPTGYFGINCDLYGETSDCDFACLLVYDLSTVGHNLNNLRSNIHNWLKKYYGINQNTTSTLPIITDAPFTFHVSENQYNAGTGYSFSLPIGVNDITYTNTDNLYNSWVIGAATGFYIDSGFGYCKCIFTDVNGVTIEVIRNFSELYLLFDRVTNWNDRIRSIRIIRLNNYVSPFAGFWDGSSIRISISTDGVGVFLSGTVRPTFTVTFNSLTTASFNFPDTGQLSATLSGDTITFSNGGTWSRVGFS